MLLPSRGVAPGYFRLSFQDVEEKALQQLFLHQLRRTCEKCELRRTVSLCPYGASLSVTGSELDKHGTAFREQK